MRILEIEWIHLAFNGETCDRCYDTGETLKYEIKQLKRLLNPLEIDIVLKETLLNADQVNKSNSILFNGTPIENILDIEISDNYCESCSSLLKSKTYCRTVKFDGVTYDDVPAKAIDQAAYRALELDESSFSSNVNPSCCGNHNSGCCENTKCCG